MPKPARTFRIDRRNSGRQYLQVHIDKLGTLIVTRTDEGIVLDLYPYKRLDVEPVATTWAHEHDIEDALYEDTDDDLTATQPLNQQGAAA